MRYLAVLLCVCLCLGSVCACGNEGHSAEALLTERMERAGALPVGEIYRFRMGKNDNTPLSDELAATLYGEEAAATCLALVEEYAIYLSSGAPYEIAVFLCYARSDTDALARMCLSRSELLRTLLGHTEYRELVFGAEITVHGRCVIMSVT